MTIFNGKDSVQKMDVKDQSALFLEQEIGIKSNGEFEKHLRHQRYTIT